MRDSTTSYHHYPRCIGQYVIIAVNLIWCLILLSYGIILFNKSSMGFNLIPKALGVYPLIGMIYTLISMLLLIYYGESYASKAISSRNACCSILPLIVTYIVMIYGSTTSTKYLTNENINNTMTLCCGNTTHSNKCDFMEKYGCESLYIASYQFYGVVYYFFIINTLYLVISGFLTVFYGYVTKKLLKYEGRISQETIENEKLKKLYNKINTKEIRSVREELMKNPHERSCFKTIDLSIYNRKLYYCSGLLSFICVILIGWSSYELYRTFIIGYNLLSKNIYICKLIFSIVLLIYSINFKIIMTKLQENKKKGYIALKHVIILIIIIFGIYFLFSESNISNFSETFDSCCINHISSSKCDFLDENDCKNINEYVRAVLSRTYINYSIYIDVMIFIAYIIILMCGCCFKLSTLQKEREKRQEFERLLIKLGYEELVNEYRSQSFLLNEEYN